jgi:hypothetical protein
MKKTQASYSAAKLRYEAQIWQMADALRNNMDAAECKHVVLGLIVRKYISDAFEGDRKDLKDDQRWACGPPPAGNANYAWAQQCGHRRAGSHFSRSRVTRGLRAA